MPASKDLGRLFALAIKVTSEAGWFWTAPTFEIEPPYRVCNRCLIFRLKPFKTALVFGWWRDNDLDEESALHQALMTRVVDLEEPSELDQELRSVREQISRSADLDDEWRLLNCDEAS